MSDQFIAAVAVNDAQPRVVANRAAEGTATGGMRTARFVRNVLALASGQLLTWVATSIIVFALPRYLGETNLGKLTFAWGFTGIFGVLMGFGTPVWLTRAIARDPESAPHLAYNALLVRIPIIALAFAVAAVAMPVMGQPRSTSVVVYIALAWTSVSTCTAIVMAALQGLERMTLMSAIGVGEKVLIAIFGVGSLAFLGAGLDTWALIVFAAGVVSLVAMTAHLWRAAGLSMRPDRRLWRTLMIGGAPFLAWSITAAVYGGIDVTMLSLLTEDKVVGWYGAAYRLVGIPAFIPFALTTALLPGLSRSSDAEGVRAAGRVLDLAVVLTLPVALLLLIGAGPIIRFLRYSEGFDHSIVLLRILSLHVPLVALSMVASTIAVARNREKGWLVISVGAAVINPLLNLAAIPYFEHQSGDGAIGAAIVTVVTEVVVCVGAFWLVGLDAFTRANITVCMRAAAACVPTAVAMWAVEPFGLIPLMLIGGATYAVFVVAFGALKIGDVKQLSRLALSPGGAS
jgi:O-antigen/teichoic acid export membrane protein